MKVILALLVLTQVFTGGVVRAQSGGVETIGETLQTLGLTELWQALIDEDLLDTLEGMAEVTLLAPTNDAIADASPIPDAELANILTYHAINVSISSTSLNLTDELLAPPSVNGDRIRFNIYQNPTDVYTVQGAIIDQNQMDVETLNGYIHVLDDVMMPPSGTIYDYISGNASFATLKTAIDAAGLAETLSGEGPFTILAPSDDAFARVPEDVLTDLVADTDALTAVLLSHVAADTLFSAGVFDGLTVDTVGEENATIVVNVNGIFIVDPEYAGVVAGDTSVTNGVLHVLDRPLYVPVTSSGGDLGQTLYDLDLRTLHGALTATGQLPTLEGLDNMTLFAPTDAALESASLPDDPSDVLAYHVIPDAAVQSGAISDELTEASLQGANIRFNIYNSGGVYTAQAAPIDLRLVDAAVVNGFVHVVDDVMDIPTQTIYQLVSSSADFSILKSAIDTAGIASVLNGTDPYTVFAPTDAAFDSLSDEVSANLDDVDYLTEVLLHHAISSTEAKAGLDNGDSLTTAVGYEMTIVINNQGRVFINTTSTSEVTGFDVSVTNGIVHVVNAVLIPGTSTDGAGTIAVQIPLLTACLALCASALKL